MESTNLRAVQFQDDMNEWQTQDQTDNQDKTNELIEVLKNAKIDPETDIKEPPTVLSIDNSDVFSMGDFSCITGKAKSKKTFLISLFIAAFLKGGISKLSTIKYGSKRRVIWFDTEQSRYHVSKAFRRVLSLSKDVKLYDIEVYNLRPHTPNERKELINHVLSTSNPDKDISFAVIDGIRDLVTDINDPSQATDVTTWLMQVTELAELHICTVLHQNKGDNNARGHLGTEIVNKAQTVLSVQIKNELSIVSAEQCRDKEFDPFAFKIDESGLPFIIDDYKEETQEGKKKLIPSDILETTHREIFESIFSHQPEYSRKDLETNIILKYHEFNIRFGESKAKEFLNHALNKEIIRHNGQSTRNARYLLVK